MAPPNRRAGKHQSDQPFTPGMHMLGKNTGGAAQQLSGLSWEADIVLNERRSRILAWRIASVAVAVAFIIALALLLLIPLKQVVPYVITVDKLTGESSIAMSSKNFVTSSTLNDKHWVKSFLLARERYNFKLLQYDYDTVKSLAGDGPWKVYSKLYDGDTGLDKKVGENTEIMPTILSITLNESGIANVRYELRTRDMRSASDPVLTRRVATIRYSYKPQGQRKEFDLIDNPLGFTVDAYQTDPEFINPGNPAGEAK
jgi:type IV secretion system protein VirB8